LPINLGPGQETALSLAVGAPVEPGDYLLEIDLLQEGVSWFALKGSRPWQGRVTVVDH
jgi:hypothetical protein